MIYAGGKQTIKTINYKAIKQIKLIDKQYWNSIGFLSVQVPRMCAEVWLEV